MANNKSQNINTDKPNKKNIKTWHALLFKFMILLAIVVAIVSYTDIKGYFEPNQANNHTSRKWDSFYKFTETDTVDVVLVGNSHLYTGVNPKNLSAALGANCFILASPGTTIMDSYYCLKEALQRTHPKVAIIETYGINNKTNHGLEGGGLSDQFKSFNARKNIPLKLASTPSLFLPEHYITAWSKTIRNHDFIFRDRKQIETNIKLKKQDEKQNKKQDEKLYLGRFITFTSGINDTTIANYKRLGAPIDGEEQKISKESSTYVKKIVKLCKDYDVTPVFVTLPAYYMHIKNYPAWKETFASAIEPTGAAWLDLQHPYDTIVFDRNCFENTMKQNQHMTYKGSLRGAYKIAHFLVDSLNVNLPKRNKTEHWHDTFYGEEGYFENYSSRKDDKTNVLVCKNKNINGFKISDCIMIKSAKNNKVLVKVRKDNTQAAQQIRMTALVKYKGKNIKTIITFNKQIDYDPLNHHLYSTYLDKDAELLKIINITKK